LFIILEGIDGGGKSTVAEKLVAALEERGYEVDLLHRGVPERNVLEEYQLDVEDYRPGGRRAIVADRWHWGDIVYGELYRGVVYAGRTGRRDLPLHRAVPQEPWRGDRTSTERAEDEILRRLRERGEDYLKLKDIEHVLRATARLPRPRPTGRRDDRRPRGGLAPQVRRVLVDRDRRTWRRSRPTSGAGLRAFCWWVIARSDPDGPSMTAMRPSPTMHGSGAYLLEALPRALWGEVGICNGNEEEDLHALLDVLAGLLSSHSGTRRPRRCARPVSPSSPRSPTRRR
jgi:hypothetical protein